MEIFKLIGSVMVDTADAQNSISKTGKEAEGLGDKLSKGIQTAKQWASGLVSGAVEIGKAMVSAAKDTAAEMDVIDKASIRMGVTAEQYQELAYAAGLSGVEVSTLEKAAKKLEGTDLNLDDAINQLMAIGDESERSKKAAELFGNSVAYQMTPLLQAGAEGMQGMRDEAHELGLVMSGEAVSQGAAMNDMFSKIEQSLGTLKNSLMSEFMPYIMEILQFIIDNVPVIKETVSKVMNGIMPIIKPIMQAVVSLFKSIFALINGDTKAFAEGFKNIFKNLGSAALTLGETIMNSLWKGLAAIWSGITQWLGNAVQNLWDNITSIGSKIANFFGGGGNAHASGLPVVPYDNYPALLHKGETVLNASDTSDLLSAIKELAFGGGSSGPITLVSQVVLDGKVVGESVTKYQREKARAYG